MKTSPKKAIGALADSVGKNKAGHVVARREFFYRHGYTAEKFVADVKAALTAAGFKTEVVDSYEMWKPFRGGGSVASNSHWYAELKLLEG